MAKYNVSSFQLRVLTNPKGFNYIELSLNLINSSQNPYSVTYNLHDDTRHTLAQMQQDLSSGLSLAQTNNISIELSYQKDRMYIFIKLPVLQPNGTVKKELFQYTAN